MNKEVYLAGTVESRRQTVLEAIRLLETIYGGTHEYSKDDRAGKLPALRVALEQFVENVLDWEQELEQES